MGRWMVLAALLLVPASLGAAADWQAPPDARGRKNPVAKTAGIKSSRAIYDANCVICHGQGGRGDGRVGAALQPKPQDLTGRAVQKQTDGELFWKISEGRGAMPAWKHLPETERWGVIHYLRSLGGKKEAGGRPG